MNNEPDKLDFVSYGLPCALRRSFMGTWCGYVGLPPSHSGAKPGYDGYTSLDITVHGGLTYGDKSWWDKESTLVWMGFDCAHYGDFMPKMPDFGGVYRTMEYAKEQCENLAKQFSLMDSYKHN